MIAGRTQSVPPTDVTPPTGGGLQRQANVRASSSPAPEQSESLQSQSLDVSDEIVAALVDTFFGCCHNQPYSFFHEGAFRQHLAEKAIPMHLILAVMASAVRFCTHPHFSGRSTATSVAYADRAWRLILSDGLSGGRVTEVSTVQTIALLGLFDFTGRLGHIWS